MTAAQKQAQGRFRAAVAEAKKLRKKNPRLSQPEALKQAFAIEYKKERSGKRMAGPTKKAAKKAAPKKAAKKCAPKKTLRKAAMPGERHTDTQSHNVNIRVMSGTRRRVGALPVGFTGKFLGWQFRVLNQYTLDGGVTAQIVESAPPGRIVAELNGRPEDIDRATNTVIATLKEKAKPVLERMEKEERAKYTGKREKFFDLSKWQNSVRNRVYGDVKKFFTLLNKEVRDYNKGKDRATKTGKVAVIKYTATVKKSALIDQIKSILSDNKKRLKYGYTTVPGKVKIKASDTMGAIMKDAASGIKKFTEHLAAIRKEKEITKRRTGLNATDRKNKAAHLSDLTKAENLTKKKLDQLKRQIS